MRNLYRFYISIFFISMISYACSPRISEIDRFWMWTSYFPPSDSSIWGNYGWSTGHIFGFLQLISDGSYSYREGSDMVGYATILEKGLYTFNSDTIIFQNALFDTINLENVYFGTDSVFITNRFQFTERKYVFKKTDEWLFLVAINDSLAFSIASLKHGGHPRMFMDWLAHDYLTRSYIYFRKDSLQTDQR